MGKVTGFLEIAREDTPLRPVEERVRDWHEVQLDPSPEEVRAQGARCMDCGIPFCHTGCPLGNIIPDWNDFAYRDRWREALERLHSTNNFPEFTGLVSSGRSSAAAGRRASSRRSGPSGARVVRWRWWARDPRAWRRRSSSPALATR